MDIKLIEHKKYIENEIIEFKKAIKAATNKSEIDSIIKSVKILENYNNDATRNFQHERLIHLIVTFFFAFLLIGSIVMLFSISLDPDIFNYSLLCVLSSIICLTLLITELFYIRHYYILENNSQKLYDSSKEIFLIIKNN